MNQPAKKATAKKASSSASAGVSSTASTPSVSESPAIKENETSPVSEDGPKSLVAQGIQEHEAELARLRKEGGKDYPNVNVSVEYPTPPPADAVETKTEYRDFVYEQHLDERRSLPGTSPYLDDVERQNAEVVRAKVEGRKPDLKNPPATQGTPLRDTRSVSLPIPEGAQKVTLPVTVAK